jgi:hypothetical protein
MDRKDLLRGKGKAGRQDKAEPLPRANVQARQVQQLHAQHLFERRIK